MSTQVEVGSARAGLARVWLFGAAAIAALLIAQTVAGKFGGQAARAWGWFLPTVLPTLTVILTAWFAAGDESKAQAVDAGVYRMAFGLSLAYVALVALTLLAQPLSSQSPLEFMTTSNLWLGPFQGLVGLGIGRFFTAKRAG